MAEVETTETFDCSPEQFYAIISDYEKYPEFLNDVLECKVISEDGNKKTVHYKINMKIKTVEYSLVMNEEANKKITWNLDKGDIFKVNNGHWILEDVGGKTKATYRVEVNFKIFVPGPIAKTAVNSSLPAMMSAYHDRIAKIYG